MSRTLTGLERRTASTTEADALAFWLGDSRHFGLARVCGGRGFHVREAKGQDVVGFPDVLMLLPCRTMRCDGSDLVVAIEIKIGNDVLSPDQRDVLDRFERAGALAMVVRYGRLREGELTQDEAVKMIEEALRR